MASAWQQAASQQAEVISARLRELLAAGLGLLRTELGLDLGLQPHQYPSWVFLAVPAGLGLLVLLLLLRAVLRGSSARDRVRDERGPAFTQAAPPAPPAKNAKGEDPKKKSKKKLPEKAKPNGRPVELVQEEVITTVKRDNVKQSVEADKKNEKMKKNKKKLKLDSKQSQPSANVDKKEAEEGNWETKISNREKRQQRKREKGTESDVIETTPLIIAESFISVSAPATGVRKTKGSAEVSAVNGSTWSEKPAKLITPQEKWVSSSGKKKAEPCNWNQEAGDANGKDWSAPWSERSIFPSLTAWSAVDGRINKAETRPPFSNIGLNSTVPAVVSDPVAQPNVSDSQWDVGPAEPSMDDEWSGLNGLSSTDPSSDWNAPAEVWGNYDEEEPVTEGQPEDPEQEALKVSDNEKDESAAQNSSSGKTKKKKKKKKKQGEESGSPTQDTEGNDGDVVNNVQEHTPEAPPQTTKITPVNAGKTNEPKKTSEPKKTNEQKKPSEPRKNSESKKTSEPKATEQKKSGEPKASEPKKAGEQKSSEPKKANEQKTNEQKKNNEPKKTSEQKKNSELKKCEEENRPVTVLMESPVINTLSDKSSSKGQQSQEKGPSVNKQNIVPPPLQGKAEENWESPKQVKKKKKARRET
ncbi:LYRIC isoform X2 [Pelobates cultripes]|uniref:LYRIC isoform X2 n=1 Tax=Pelobates cultripes TaxID=61616 RepID=A0AAD1W6S5_PELCU|nr:LYRIC isoform X2 [Pelobates cultripes]